MTVSKFKKKLDKIYSLWLRQSYANYQGYVTCITCSKQLPWKESQCSHYVSRSHNATRYEPTNTHCACKACNIFKGGALDEYALYIINRYGVEELERLRALKWTIKQFTIPELEELCEIYQKKLKELQ